MDYETGLNMAKMMKAEDHRIRQAIRQCEQARHGVVALKFTDQGTRMRVEILDEPYQSDVRVYPGE